MMETSVQELEDAVNTFYGSTNGTMESHNILTQAQHTKSAWNYAFQFLDPNKVNYLLIIYLW